ncbi:MAG: FHA domain-containing protein, partial [Actinomycetes bacterium]
PAPVVQGPVPFGGGPAGANREAPLAQPAAGFDPDHDGQTVMKSSLAGTGSGPSTTPPAAQQDATGGPLVLARVCAQGHANPPTRAQCSACGGALLPDAVQVARPRLGRIRLSTGELLDLDQSMVIGRQPSVARVQGGVMPRLVQVASPGGDISRSHVEVRLEGWHVMLCDLKATNGTVLVREGQPPRRLAQNEMAILLDGDLAELGDNISLRFEEIP